MRRSVVCNCGFFAAEMDLNQFYSHRISEFSEAIRVKQGGMNRLATLRLTTAVSWITCGLFLLFGSSDWYWIAICAITLPLFVYFVISYASAKREVRRLRLLKKRAEIEEQAVQGNISDLKTGNEYRVKSHQVALDLDVFGNGSLFQQIERLGMTETGPVLAHELLQPTTNQKSLLGRREAFQELSEMVDWRHDFWVTAQLNEPRQSDKEVKWTDGNWLFFKNRTFWRALLWLSPSLLIGSLMLYGFNIIPEQIPIYHFILNLIITGIYLKRVNKVHVRLSKGQRTLMRYSSLLTSIGKQTFRSNLLLKLQKDATYGGIALKKLKSAVDQFDARLNVMMGVVLNGVFLWDIRSVLRVEEWQHNYSSKTDEWIHTTRTFDAFCCLANYVFNYPEYRWPNFVKEPALEAKGMAHPLMTKKGRVSNDFTLKPDGQIVLLSGANMSGKSTFLRTVGLNSYMAQLGLPVCADSFSFKPISIETSMRINDSLQESESYFYSELKRLKSIVDRIKDGEEILVLLDEILRGTNSNDKHEGSAGLIKQLVRLNTSGIIASHDVGLAGLSQDYPEQVINMSFEVENVNGELVFDYKLREGVCQNLNASYLMRKMGITEDPSTDERPTDF